MLLPRWHFIRHADPDSWSWRRVDSAGTIEDISETFATLQEAARDAYGNGLELYFGWVIFLASYYCVFDSRPWKGLGWLPVHASEWRTPVMYPPRVALQTETLLSRLHACILAAAWKVNSWLWKVGG